MIRKALGAALLLASACACVAAPPPIAGTAPNTPPNTPASTPASRAERIAASFTAAADAERSGDTAALARAVQVIAASGPHPLEQSAEDPVQGWQAKAAPSATAVYRGRPLGPGYRSGRLNNGGSESFSQLFLSGTGATIALSAPTGDKLSLRVLDPQARPICSGDAMRGNMCRWVPLFTQRYTIEVTNLGTGDARYFLVIE